MWHLIPRAENWRVTEHADGALTVELRTGDLLAIPARSWTKTFRGWLFPRSLVRYSD
jgi:hypothetical protein